MTLYIPYFVTYIILAILTLIHWLFGIQRGGLLRKSNYHIVAATNYALIVWYSAGSYELLMMVAPMGEFLLTRPFASFTIILALSLIILQGAHQDISNIIFHVFWLLLTFVTWWWALIVDDAHIYWAYTSAALSITFLSHVWFERSLRPRDIVTPLYVMSDMVCLYVYFTTFYLFTYLGPWLGDVISLNTQEIILSIMDIIAMISITICVFHYGWKPAMNPNTTKSNIPARLMHIIQY